MPTVNRDDFLFRLEAVSAGLSPREALEQSSCFAFRDGEVLTFNDEVSVRGPSLLPDELEGAVLADPLLKILRKMRSETVDVSFDVDGGHLIVKGGPNRKAGIKMELDILMKLDKVELPKKWRKIHKDFTDAITIVSECAAKQSEHFFLTCIHLHPDWVEAFDNEQGCRYPIDSGLDESALVRRESLVHILALDMMETSETRAWIHFRNRDGLIFSCRRYTDKYMDLAEFFDVEGEPADLPKDLVEACDSAGVFSSESKDNNRVLIQLRNGAMKVRGEGSRGFYDEVTRVGYDGPALDFMVSPGLIAELVKRHNRCEIAPNRLKVDGGRYVYASSLATPEEIERAEARGKMTKNEKDKGD